MTEEKKSKNPFINMANAAKKSASLGQSQLDMSSPKQKAQKPSKGFGGATTVRRTGRGR
jgi:hypothetical protein